MIDESNPHSQDDPQIEFVISNREKQHTKQPFFDNNTIFSHMRVHKEEPLQFEVFAEKCRKVYDETFTHVIEEADLKFDVYNSIAIDKYVVWFPQFCNVVIVKDGKEVAIVDAKFEGPLRNSVWHSKDQIYFISVSAVNVT